MNPSHIKFLNTVTKWNNSLTLFGLNSIKEIERDINNVRYGISYSRFVYCIFLTMFLSCIFGYQFQFVNHALDHQTLASEAVGMYLLYSGSCETFLILITGFFRNKKYASLLQNIIRCEFKFRESEANEITKRSARVLVFFSIVLSFSFTGDLISRRNEGMSFEMVLNIVIGYTFLCYNILTVAHFAIAQFWVQKSFIRINKDLVKYCSVVKIGTKSFLGDDEKSGFVIDYLINELMTVNVQQKVFNRINYNENVLIKDCKIVEKIRQLRILYNDVFNIAREMDGFFATSCVIVIISNLLMCTLLFFVGLQNLTLYFKTSQDFYKHDMTSTFKGAALCLASISGMIWPCGKTCNEAYKISLIIQDHLVRVKHEELKAELKEFALQVQQQKVFFSPHGFFFLESRTFLSVLAEITSYLVILIQFLPMNILSVRD